MDTMRVISLNVRGLKNKRNRQCVFNLVKKEKYDLINLQECHITTEEEAAQWGVQFGGKLFCSSGTARSLGQAVLINKSLMQSTELVFKDERVIAVQIKHLDRTITIINTYAHCPTTEKISTDTLTM